MPTSAEQFSAWWDKHQGRATYPQDLRQLCQDAYLEGFRLATIRAREIVLEGGWGLGKGSSILARIANELVRVGADDVSLYEAARDAYELITSTSEIKHLSNPEHSRVIDNLSAALLAVEEK